MQGVKWFYAVLLLLSLCSEAEARGRRLRPDISVTRGPNLEILVSVKTPLKLLSRGGELVLKKSTNGAGYQRILSFKNPRQDLLLIDVVERAGYYQYRAFFDPQEGRLRKSRPAALVVLDETKPDQELSEPEPQYVPLPAGFSECAPGIEQEVLRLVNEKRRLHNVAPVEQHGLLYQAARVHSIKMGQAQSLEHGAWFEEIIATGYQGTHFAQNIASYFKDPAILVDAWYESSGHHENMLNVKDTFSGVACVADQAGKYWWSQNFGN